MATRRRGRPSNRDQRIKVAVDILVELVWAEIRTKAGISRAKGQRGIGEAYRKTILRGVAEEYERRMHSSISVRTLERYFSDHRPDAIAVISKETGDSIMREERQRESQIRKLVAEVDRISRIPETTWAEVAALLAQIAALR